MQLLNSSAGSVTTWRDRTQTSNKYWKSFSRTKTASANYTDYSMFSITVSAGNPNLNFHSMIYWSNQSINTASHFWSFGFFYGNQIDTSGNWGIHYGPGGAYTSGAYFYESYGIGGDDIGTFTNTYSGRVWTFNLHTNSQYTPQQQTCFVDIWCTDWNYATLAYL